MNKHLRVCALTCIAVVAAFAVASWGASAASAQQDTGYACLPGDQLTPETFLSTDTIAFASWDTFATGAWSPYAETSVPTGAVVGNYYLTCTQWNGWTQVGTYALGNGQLAPTSGPKPYVNPLTNLPIPGAYPVIQLSTAPAS